MIEGGNHCFFRLYVGMELEVRRFMTQALDQTEQYALRLMDTKLQR